MCDNSPIKFCLVLYTKLYKTSYLSLGPGTVDKSLRGAPLHWLCPSSPGSLKIAGPDWGV